MQMLLLRDSVCIFEAVLFCIYESLGMRKIIGKHFNSVLDPNFNKAWMEGKKKVWCTVKHFLNLTALISHFMVWSTGKSFTVPSANARALPGNGQFYALFFILHIESILETLKLQLSSSGSCSGSPSPFQVEWRVLNLRAAGEWMGLSGFLCH